MSRSWKAVLAAVGAVVLVTRRCLRAAFVDTQGVTELSRGLVAA
jgi:hypothetical protein